MSRNDKERREAARAERLQQQQDQQQQPTKLPTPSPPAPTSLPPPRAPTKPISVGKRMGKATTLNGQTEHGLKIRSASSRTADNLPVFTHLYSGFTPPTGEGHAEAKWLQFVQQSHRSKRGLESHRGGGSSSHRGGPSSHRSGLASHRATRPTTSPAAAPSPAAAAGAPIAAATSASSGRAPDAAPSAAASRPHRPPSAPAVVATLRRAHVQEQQPVGTQRLNVKLAPTRVAAQKTLTVRDAERGGRIVSKLAAGREVFVVETRELEVGGARTVRALVADSRDTDSSTLGWVTMARGDEPPLLGPSVPEAVPMRSIESAGMFTSFPSTTFPSVGDYLSNLDRELAYQSGITGGGGSSGCPRARRSPRIIGAGGGPMQTIAEVGGDASGSRSGSCSPVTSSRRWTFGSN